MTAIKPWLFEFFPELDGNPDPDDVHRYFERYLRLWARDEALGFEGIRRTRSSRRTSFTEEW